MRYLAVISLLCSALAIFLRESPARGHGPRRGFKPIFLTKGLCALNPSRKHLRAFAPALALNPACSPLCSPLPAGPPRMAGLGQRQAPLAANPVYSLSQSGWLIVLLKIQAPSWISHFRTIRVKAGLVAQPGRPPPAKSASSTPHPRHHRPSKDARSL